MVLTLKSGICPHQSHRIARRCSSVRSDGARGSLFLSILPAPGMAGEEQRAEGQAGQTPIGSVFQKLRRRPSTLFRSWPVKFPIDGEVRYIEKTLNGSAIKSRCLRKPGRVERVL